MKDALLSLTIRDRQLAAHPLYSWINWGEYSDARGQLGAFVPALPLFLTRPFHDSLFLNYPKEQDGWSRGTERAMRRSIRAQLATAGESAASPVLDDIELLGLDHAWGLQRPSTLLWSLWGSPQLDAARANLSRRVASMVAPRHARPQFRHLLLEQREHERSLWLGAAAACALTIERQQGVRSRFFGAQVTGQAPARQGWFPFKRLTLSSRDSLHAFTMIDERHKLAVEMNDLMHAFGLKARSARTAGRLLETEKDERVADVAARIKATESSRLRREAVAARRREEGTQSPPSLSSSSSSVSMTLRAASAQQRVFDAWSRERHQLHGHPAIRLVRTASGADAAFALRGVALLFAQRVTMMRTILLHDLEVDPNAPGASVLRRLCEVRARQAEVFFHDWQELEMDQRVPWSPEGLLRFWFYDPDYGRAEMEALHRVRALILGRDRRLGPVMAYWVLRTLESMTDALIAATREAAARVPGAPVLPYLTGLAPELAGDEGGRYGSACAEAITALPLSEEEEAELLRTMLVISRLGRVQFDRLMRALTADRDRFDFLAESGPADSSTRLRAA